MKKIMVGLALAASTFISSAALACDMQGKWDFNVSIYSGLLNITSSNGSSFSGSLKLYETGQFSEVKGTCSGSRVVFTRYIQGIGNQVYTGRLNSSEDSLGGSYSGVGGGDSFYASRR